jgi:hypothetical protein
MISFSTLSFVRINCRDASHIYLTSSFLALRKEGSVLTETCFPTELLELLATSKRLPLVLFAYCSLSLFSTNNALGPPGSHL